MNILIRNIDIITGDDRQEFIKNGNIAICDDVIAYAGYSENMPCSPEDGSVSIYGNSGGFKADRIIDGKNRLAMPGLVNAHTHCAMTLMRNHADDLPLEDWLFNRIFPVEARLDQEDVYWGTQAGISEMIKSGTVSFADMYLHMDAVARAVNESGIRANLSVSPYKFNMDGKPENRDEVEKCVSFHKKWDGVGNSMIKVYVEVHSAYLFDREKLINASYLAKQLNTGIQIHILETAWESKNSMERYGMSPVELCLECGIFDVPVIAAHCVHLSDNDMDILRSKGINIAHNPTSNLKLGSGIARVPLMIDRGINVALGTDGTASNNNLNMFEEMNLAALLHKGVNMNPLLVDAPQALKMATRNGAKALGFADVTGVIKKGMKADIVILDTDKPHYYPINNAMSAVVYSAQGEDVDTLIVNGNILMEKRQLKTLDEELIKHKTREVSHRLLTI